MKKEFSKIEAKWNESKTDKTANAEALSTFRNGDLKDQKERITANQQLINILEQFNDLDLSKDREIETSEFKAKSSFEAIGKDTNYMTEIDLDHDQKISINEFKGIPQSCSKTIHEEMKLVAVKQNCQICKPTEQVSSDGTKCVKKNDCDPNQFINKDGECEDCDPYTAPNSAMDKCEAPECSNDKHRFLKESGECGDCEEY